MLALFCWTGACITIIFSLLSFLLKLLFLLKSSLLKLVYWCNWKLLIKLAFFLTKCNLIKCLLFESQIYLNVHGITNLSRLWPPAFFHSIWLSISINKWIPALWITVDGILFLYLYLEHMPYMRMDSFSSYKTKERVMECQYLVLFCWNFLAFV